MRRVSILAVALVFGLASGASAQRWSEEEQTVIDHVKMCHDAWAETVEQEVLTVWLDKCQPAEEFVGWWISDGALWNLEADRRTFPVWVKGVKRFSWENLQPLEVKVEGDVALIWFYVTFTLENPEVKSRRIQEKRFEVLRKTGGAWPGSVPWCPPRRTTGSHPFARRV
jgi:hypothetical protein